jgi:hypothetical protein
MQPVFMLLTYGFNLGRKYLQQSCRCFEYFTSHKITEFATDNTIENTDETISIAYSIQSKTLH